MYIPTSSTSKLFGEYLPPGLLFSRAPLNCNCAKGHCLATDGAPVWLASCSFFSVRERGTKLPPAPMSQVRLDRQHRTDRATSQNRIAESSREKEKSKFNDDSAHCFPAEV